MTDTVHVGIFNKIAVGKETTPGTPVAMTNAVEVDSGSAGLWLDPQTADFQGTRGELAHNVDRVCLVKKDSGFDFGGVFSHEMKTLLLDLMGLDPAADDKPCFTAQQERGTLLQQNAGCKIAEVVFSATSGQALTYKVTGPSRAVTITSGTIASGATFFVTDRPFLMSDGALTVDAGDVPVSKIEVKRATPLSEGFYNSLVRQQAVENDEIVSGVIEVDWTVANLNTRGVLAKWLAGTTAHLAIDFAISADVLGFEMYNVVYEGRPPGHLDRNIMNWALPFKAYKDASHAALIVT